MIQVGKGLLGAFIVDPKDKQAYYGYGERGYDKEYTLILNDESEHGMFGMVTALIVEE